MTVRLFSGLPAYYFLVPGDSKALTARDRANHAGVDRQARCLLLHLAAGLAGQHHLLTSTTTDAGTTYTTTASCRIITPAAAAATTTTTRSSRTAPA